jgi:hypothetical protein
MAMQLKKGADMESKAPFPNILYTQLGHFYHYQSCCNGGVFTPVFMEDLSRAQRGTYLNIDTVFLKTGLSGPLLFSIHPLHRKYVLDRVHEDHIVINDKKTKELVITDLHPENLKRNF